MHSTLVVSLLISTSMVPYVLSVPISASKVHIGNRDASIEERDPHASVAPLPVPGIDAGLAGYQPEPDTSGMTGSQADKALQDYSHQQQSTPAGRAHEAAKMNNDRMGGSIAHDDTHKRDSPTEVEKRAPNPSVAPLPVPGINAGIAPEPDTSGMTGSQADKALQDYSHQQQGTPAGQAHEAAKMSNDRMAGSIAHDDTHKRDASADDPSP